MRRVTDIAFEPDGTAIVAYLDSGDIRCEGAVTVRRQVRIEPNRQYAPDIERLVARCNALVNDALADWESSEPVPAELLGPPQPGQERPSEEALEDDATAERNWARIEEARSLGDQMAAEARETVFCGDQRPHGPHTHNEAPSGEHDNCSGWVADADE